MNLKLIKKIVSILAVLIWVALIFKIFLDGGNMQEQLPKCIFTTMITFSILISIIKFIEFKENN
jgi:hypothetical protein